MGFGVDTEAMASSATKIGLAAEQLDSMMSKMNEDVAQMLGGWGGDGAQAHSNLHTRYQEDVVTIIKNLREMQVALQSTHQLYVTQETEQHSDHLAMRNQIAT